MGSAEYLGVVCTSLLLDRPLGGYYVTNITDTWVPLTGVIEMGSIVVDPKYLGGNYLVYLPRYLLADEPALSEPDDSIHERCLSTIWRRCIPTSTAASAGYPNGPRQACDGAADVELFAAPTPVVNQRAGLYILNSAQITKGNLNVNETIEHVEARLADSF